MISLHRHILTIGRLVVLLFFVANSGFTVVLYHCTMEKMGCCTGSDEHMSSACTMMDPPEPSSGPSVAEVNDCHSVIIAGGVKTDPTVVEKESVARVIKVDPPATATTASALSAVSSRYQPLSSSASQNASSPAVETYVLNATFLI